jgi:DNA-binding transcriptional MerR regulator
MQQYSVKMLSKLAGVSVRTLHLYDKIGLLKPQVRTKARYRLYGEKQLLKLQQILFYKELDFPLKEIISILEDPAFDLLQALEGHKSALESRKSRISVLLKTVENTILKLKENTMLKIEELYEGLPKEKVDVYRQEIADRYGKETIEKSESFLRKMSKEKLRELNKRRDEITKRLFLMKNMDATSEEVQAAIEEHYHIIRIFWGTVDSKDKQPDAYKGLGELYMSNQEYTSIDGRNDADFPSFLWKAMNHFADTKLI